MEQSEETEKSHHAVEEFSSATIMEGERSPCGGNLVFPTSGDTARKSSWDSYDTVFLNSKAGMDGVDKKKVQKVVYEMSKGSQYFLNEQRKEAALLQKIQDMNSLIARLTPALIAEHERLADLKIIELEASRDLSRVWLHVDMDAFYAAVETLEDPTLGSKPMAVGGMSMICTANYEARKFGVRAAMPGFIARKLCPNLVFVRPDFTKYSKYSKLSREVFRAYDPNFIARSMDEAYLDITEACSKRGMSPFEADKIGLLCGSMCYLALPVLKGFNSGASIWVVFPVKIAEELRSCVHKATKLTCSAGVGPNRLLAKVCSDINKPNGQFIMSNNRAWVMAFISELPIRKVSGIGKVTDKLLKEILGISICADLIKNRALISALFSQASRDFFLAVGLGIGGSERPEEEHRKSLSNERTFPAMSDENDLFTKLDELAEILAIDMDKEGLQGRTLSLKLKTTAFEMRTRAITLNFFIHSKLDILEHASTLLRREFPLSLRLMGLKMSQFKDEKPYLTDHSQRTITSFISHFPGSTRNCNRGSQVGQDQVFCEENLGGPVLDGVDCAIPELSCAQRQSYLNQASPCKKTILQGLEHDDLFADYQCISGSKVRRTSENLSPKTSPGKLLRRGQQTLNAFIHPENIQGHPNSSVLEHSEISNLQLSFHPPLSSTSITKGKLSYQTGAGQSSNNKLASLHRNVLSSKQVVNTTENNCQSLERVTPDLCSMYQGCGKDLECNTQCTNIQQMECDRLCGLGMQIDNRQRASSQKGLIGGSFNDQVTRADHWNSGVTGVGNLMEMVEQERSCLRMTVEDSCGGLDWSEDNRCSLCGFEIEGCLLTSRQEHEDYHLAVLLQKQADSEFQNIPIPGQSPRRASERGLGIRRKVGCALQIELHAKSQQVPIETFFCRTKHAAE